MTVLHYLRRDGVALCGGYPKPHLIRGDEDECPTCGDLFVPVRRRTRANRLTPEERSKKAKARSHRDPWQDR